MLTEHLLFSNCESHFINYNQLRGLSKRTIKLYGEELRYFREWLQQRGITTIKEVTSPLLREWFSTLGTHRNHGGVSCNFRIIKCFLRWIDNEYEPDGFKNPINKVKLPTNHQEPLPEIPLENIRLLLNVVSNRHNLRDIAILKCLVDGGFRANELLGLNYGDVNLQTGEVRIHHGKGDKFRVIWIYGAKKSLSDYLDTRNDLNNDSPLFLSDYGTRLKYSGLRQIIKRLCARANLQEFPLHSFRRCFALTLFRRGIDIVTIGRLLGHSSGTAVTLRYLNIGNSDLKELHQKASPADLL